MLNDERRVTGIPAAEQLVCPVKFTTAERDRIKVFADRGRRNVRNQILVWLEAAEALYADATPELLDKADAVKRLSRPGAGTLDETA